jgi:hypothetical protein
MSNLEYHVDTLNTAIGAVAIDGRPVLADLLYDVVLFIRGQDEENKELTERLRVACETIEQLKRVNKEWEQLWEPIDDLIRPITPLGGDVSKEVLSIIEDCRR